VLFRGLTAGILQLMAGGVEAAAPARVALRSSDRRAPAATVTQPSELSQYRYCTSFLIKGEGLDKAAFERFLLPIGDSALVVGDERMVKVHVHTNDPGVVLTQALSMGSIGEVEINDMHEQTRARDERLQERAPAAETGTAVVAVVAGEGNKALFKELGCAAIVDGGQSMNPSAAQLLEAVEGLGAEEAVILPNNGNVVLTAEQAAGMSPRHIAVVPTTSIPVGLAAMVAFEPDADAVDNARLMEDAIAGISSAEVTRAVRDSELDGVQVRKDQAMGLVDGRLVAAAESLEQAFAGVLETFVQGGAEYITVLTALNGSGVPRERLEELAAELAPEAEVHFHEGGQPLYPILASAE